MTATVQKRNHHSRKKKRGGARLNSGPEPSPLSFDQAAESCRCSTPHFWQVVNQNRRPSPMLRDRIADWVAQFTESEHSDALDAARDFLANS
jgi:hypothetical protein